MVDVVGWAKRLRAGFVTTAPLDIARIEPTVTPAAAAIFCACARAPVTRSDNEHGGACCKAWAEGCVPEAPKDMLEPGLFCAMLFCTALSRPMVLFMVEKGAGSRNDHSKKLAACAEL